MSAVLRAGQPQRRGQWRCTFQDVDALLVGWVGVWVVRGREHAAVNVAHPCATVVLIGDLAAMFARGIFKQRRDKQMGYRAEWIDERVIEGLSESEGVR